MALAAIPATVLTKLHKFFLISSGRAALITPDNISAIGKIWQNQNKRRMGDSQHFSLQPSTRGQFPLARADSA
jgi:hypothetical protein